MKEVLETIFTAILQFLANEHYISLEHYFVDGTKIEANANMRARGFRRFLFRGLEKVTLEVGWLSLAHNLLKQAANTRNAKKRSSNNGATPFKCHSQMKMGVVHCGVWQGVTD
ncbi:hypothetical protein MHH28_15520 [Paenibacillus sp. FSL K6-1217]|uniref:hypothetical protein n=1 Tax=Paenibacillus sp. FSL K6-1217 TaxID=2921466 RepID=UPI003254F646